MVKRVRFSEDEIDKIVKEIDGKLSITPWNKTQHQLYAHLKVILDKYADDFYTYDIAREFNAKLKHFPPSIKKISKVDTPKIHDIVESVSYKRESYTKTTSLQSLTFPRHGNIKLKMIVKAPSPSYPHPSVYVWFTDIANLNKCFIIANGKKVIPDTEPTPPQFDKLSDIFPLSIESMEMSSKVFLIQHLIYHLDPTDEKICMHIKTYPNYHATNLISYFSKKV